MLAIPKIGCLKCFEVNLKWTVSECTSGSYWFCHYTLNSLHLSPLLITGYICAGRTGRAGKKGTATTFLTYEDSGVFFDLKTFLTNNNQAIPPELARHEAAKNKVIIRKHFKEWNLSFAYAVCRVGTLQGSGELACLLV